MSQVYLFSVILSVASATPIRSQAGDWLEIYGRRLPLGHFGARLRGRWLPKGRRVSPSASAPGIAPGNEWNSECRTTNLHPEKKRKGKKKKKKKLRVRSGRGLEPRALYGRLNCTPATPSSHRPQ